YSPCGIALAASFNPEVARGVGTGIGYDARARGVGIMLCPGVNIYRSPLCGRNFEYMGEDPYLASETAAKYITGIQKQGVMATIKHFALNNQEYDRHVASSNADERTMNEIYFPTFRKAVEEARVGAVMTCYNPVNGQHAAENSWLINENLRKWGFEGFVMSDWVSTYTPIGCAMSGLDMEMPNGYAMNYNTLKPLIDNGVVPERVIDEKCIHILQAFIAYGFLDKPMKDSSIPEDYDVSRQLAYQAAVEAPVLLKNDGVLPIKGGKILLVGPNADYVTFGGGSGAMHPLKKYEVTLYQGLCNLGKKYNVTLRNGIPGNVAELKNVDAIIVAAGFNKTTERENSDRQYALDKDQVKLIDEAVATGKKVVVIVYSGGEVDLSKWGDKVNAIVMAWYTGQEGGRALADILSGKVSPSGRLPFTFWGSLKKNPSTPYYHPAKLDESVYTKHEPGHYASRHAKFPFIDYGEGVFVGYRGIRHFGVEPLYPFGYGLTYSTFAYSDASVAKVTDGYEVCFTLTNTGQCEATEAVQIYVAPQSPSIIRPERELKGLAKVKLAKGAKQVVKVLLPMDAFKYYDIFSHDWVLDPGAYNIEVAASATDIKLSTAITVE
ncbi:MAG: glycoside hydrolase family 3 C-terminal domain-containing protein, partial [Bacteroidales bacterium]|nr:glycoside hydrolase family 3 C-terminal domain-containing protein [Bacteroidales bacterium]